MSFDRVQFRSSVESAEESVPVSPVRSAPEARPLTAAPAIAPAAKVQQKQGASMKVVLGVLVFVLVAGAGTGVVLSRVAGGTAAPVAVEQNVTAEEVENSVKVGAIFGVPDQATFRDEVEGVLIKGGIAGEGSHTLLREGDASQNVYLTSSVVDLDQFEGMRVKVWGETFKGQKAGWLMDVGRLEVAELSAEKPSWYKETNE